MKSILTRYIAFAAAVFFLSATSYASAEPVTFETCIGIGQFAELVMQVRQQGTPREEILLWMTHLEPHIHDLISFLVLDAYEIPVMRDPVVKASVIEAFQERWIARCLSSL
jgi:hypothetical protein